jgi:gas vesicle protein
MTKRKGNLAIGGLFLAGLGYVAGILTAPKSGKETRKDIHDGVAKAKTEAEKKLKQLHTELGELVDKGKGAAKNLSAKAKEELDAAVAKAQAAKTRAKEVLSGLHEGESDDKELQKAIDEAKQAVDHLRKYVGKHVPKKD